MKILITGGTGLIGRTLCRALLDAGHQLTVLSRKPESVKGKCGDAVDSISSLSQWNEKRIFDAVINLAGEPIVDARWTELRKKALWDSRVTLTEELVERIRLANHKPAVLLSGSAIGYYGDRGDQLLDESSDPANDFAAKLCQAWEAAAQDAADLGVRVCLLRTGLVLSSRGGLLGRMSLPFKLGLGARLGEGGQWMSWIHLDDYVAIVISLLASAEIDGPVNMTAPEPVTNGDFTAKLARALHRPALFAAPRCVLKFMLGERADMLLGGQRVLPAKLVARGFRFAFPDIACALRAEFAKNG
jgi:uncharacterized protein (TIGR01777 family)